MREEISEWKHGKTICLYDENDLLIKLTDLDDSDQVSLTVDYLYDTNGNNIERVAKNAAGALVRRLCFLFDDAGKEIKHTEYDEHDDLRFTKVMDYNQEPGRVKVSTYDSDGELLEVTLEDDIE